MRFLPSGDSALTVEFGERIDRRLSELVLELDHAIARAELPGVVETVPTFRSLLIHFDPLRTDCDSLRDALATLSHGEAKGSEPSRLWKIPVCYEDDCAPDLEDVARATGLTASQVIERHAGEAYHVYMVGFLPGYPYMGDVPEELRLPRMENPRTHVPPGSVAIATAMTAIYPINSPGGWHLIGNTPIQLFDPFREDPALLSPGDTVRFEPISGREHARLRDLVASKAYEVPCEETIT